MKTGRLLISGLLLLLSFPAWSQKGTTSRTLQQETVILQREPRGETTIELTPEGIYLNGEKVASRSDLNNRYLHKKIIIRDRGTGDTRSYEDYYNSGRGTTSGRALLGVFTDARKSGDGAFIQRVSPGSPAFAAGLRSGDVILRVDTMEIYDASDLTRAIARYEPGDRVNIVYNRGGRDRQTTARLTRAEADPWSDIYEYPRSGPGNMPAPPPVPDFFDNGKPRLGISIEDTESGVLIRSVRSGSPAEEAGLREGDVITYLDDRRIDRVEEVLRAVSGLRSGGRIKVEVNRKGSRITRSINLPQERAYQDL